MYILYVISYISNILYRHVSVCMCTYMKIYASVCVYMSYKHYVHTHNRFNLTSCK